jgi:hypothetical protein
VELGGLDLCGLCGFALTMVKHLVLGRWDVTYGAVEDRVSGLL